MQRIATSTRAVNANGTGKDGFTGGNPATATPATNVSADFLNGVQESICLAVEESGQALSTSHRQLSKAIAPGFAALQAALDETARYDANLATTLVNRNALGGSAVSLNAAAEDVTNDVVVLACSGASQLISQASGATGFASRSLGGGSTAAQYAVCRGPSLFVSVGSAASIQTSPDGVTWTARTPPAGATDAYTEIVWWAAQSRYAALSSPGGALHTSTDGITWTAASIGAWSAPRALLVWGSDLLAFTDTTVRKFSSTSTSTVLSGALPATFTEVQAVGGVIVALDASGVVWCALNEAGLIAGDWYVRGTCSSVGGARLSPESGVVSVVSGASIAMYDVRQGASGAFRHRPKTLGSTAAGLVRTPTRWVALAYGEVWSTPRLNLF